MSRLTAVTLTSLATFSNFVGRSRRFARGGPWLGERNMLATDGHAFAIVRAEDARIPVAIPSPSCDPPDADRGRRRCGRVLARAKLQSGNLPREGEACTRHRKVRVSL